MMTDVLNVLKELLALMPSFPVWLRYFHYIWILGALTASFSTLVWYTSASAVPIRVAEQAKARQPAGVPIELQSQSLEAVKARIVQLQAKGLDEMERGELESSIESFRSAQIYLNEALIRSSEETYVQNLRGYMLKDWAQVSLRLGREAEAKQLLKQAEQTFNLVLRSRPDTTNMANGHNGLGSVYLIRGDAEGAEREIKRALAILPDHPAAKHDLAIVERIKRQRAGD